MVLKSWFIRRHRDTPPIKLKMVRPTSNTTRRILPPCSIHGMWGSKKPTIKKEEWAVVVVAQLVERLLHIPEVRSSNPVIGKNLYWTFPVNYIEETKIKEKEVGNGVFLKKQSKKYFNVVPAGFIDMFMVPVWVQWVEMTPSNFLPSVFHEFCFKARRWTISQCYNMLLVICSNLK